MSWLHFGLGITPSIVHCLQLSEVFEAFGIVHGSLTTSAWVYQPVLCSSKSASAAQEDLITDLLFDNFPLKWLTPSFDMQP